VSAPRLIFPEQRDHQPPTLFANPSNVTAVDNGTGHAIAIVRAGHDEFQLYDGNSMATTHSTQIEHPQGRSSYSVDELKQMFATRKLSILEGQLER
jgi:hypothetical protein